MNLIDIVQTEDEKIKQLAKQLGIETPSKQSRDELNNLVYNELIKREVKAQSEARAKIQLENQAKLDAMGGDKKPAYDSPEARAIRESKKVFALFKNMANPGFSETFNKGCVYDFTLFDNRVHILPKWLIDDFRRSRSGTTPKFTKRTNPVTGAEEIIEAGVERKFFFQEIGDVSEKDAKAYKDDTGCEFGVVLDRKVLDKLNVVDDSKVEQSRITV